MKILMIGMLSLFSLGALANQGMNKKDWDKMTFEQQKQMKVQMLENKSAMIQKSQTCVNAAKDKSDLKECSEEMKEAKQSMMDKMNKKGKQSQEENKTGM